MKKIVYLIFSFLMLACTQNYELEDTIESAYLAYIPDSLAKTYNDEGVKYLLQNRYDEAEKFLKNAIEIDTNYRLAYVNLINNFWRKGAFGEATEIVDLWIRRNGGDAGILFLKGASLYCEGEIDEALKVYRECEKVYESQYLQSKKKEDLFNRMYVLRFLDQNEKLTQLYNSERDNFETLPELYDYLINNDVYAFLPCEYESNISNFKNDSGFIEIHRFTDINDDLIGIMYAHVVSSKVYDSIQIKTHNGESSDLLYEIKWNKFINKSGIEMEGKTEFYGYKLKSLKEYFYIVMVDSAGNEVSDELMVVWNNFLKKFEIVKT